MRHLPAFVALTCALALGVPAAASGDPAAPGVTSRAKSTPSFNSTVWAIAFRGDIVYVGGSFTTATVGGRTVARKKLAAYNARTGSLLSWAPAANGTVRSLAVAGSAVYAAGDFDTISGLRRDSLARLDGVTGKVAPFAHTVSGEAATLAIGNGRVYVGGHFSKIDGAVRRNLAAFSHTTGRLDGTWKPFTDDRVKGLAVTRDRVYLGGGFHQVNGSNSAVRVAAVHPAGGALIKGFKAKAPATVLDVAVDGAGVYTATGGPGGRAVGYTTSGKIRWTHLFDGDVHTLTVMGGVTYVGGHFDRACKTTSTIVQLGCPAGYASRVKLAALDGGGRLTSWNPHANGKVGVQVLATNSARRQIGAGGAFTRMGGAGRERFALFG